MMKSDQSSPLTVVVTGAAAGVGRAIALRFAAAGARLGLISRDEPSLAALAGEIEQMGNRCSISPVDVSDAAAVFGAAERFEQDLGPIDIWINDAMVTVFSPVHEISAEEFERVTNVTYLGTVHGCMAALRHMRPRRRGQIINIGSALAYRGIPLQAAYCGAKHAIRGFTAALRSELEHDRTGLTLTMIELPAVNTPQFEWARTHMPNDPRPMGTVYQPEVIGEAAFQASQTRPREYWVGGSTFLTIIGNMIAPAYLDRFLARRAVRGQATDQPVSPDRKDNLLTPVTALHRTHGRFGAEAKHSAMIVNGSVARIAVVAVGALVFFLLGCLSASRPTPTDRRYGGSCGRWPARSVRGN